jgi:YesN/AraC family two-component response regulator
MRLFVNLQSSINNPSAINNHKFGGAMMLSNQQSTTNNQQSLRVLLVEDNRTYREVFKDFLRQQFQGISIDEAENGDEALQKIKATPPDLIFMDIRLPGTSGLQLTRMIKKEYPNIQIAILTGYDVLEYREAAAQYGACGFLVKESLKWEEVEALVKSITAEGNS